MNVITHAIYFWWFSKCDCGICVIVGTRVWMLSAAVCMTFNIQTCGVFECWKAQDIPVTSSQYAWHLIYKHVVYLYAEKHKTFQLPVPWTDPVSPLQVTAPPPVTVLLPPVAFPPPPVVVPPRLLHQSQSLVHKLSTTTNCSPSSTSCNPSSTRYSPSSTSYGSSTSCGPSSSSCSSSA